MEQAGTSSYGRAAEALSKTFSNNPEKFNLSLRSMPSLQPRSPPVYSPNTRVFDTPEQSSHLPARDEGLFTLHRGTARAEVDHAFQEQMDQYAREQLSKEWDGLFLGDGSVDVHNGEDAYRQFRKDMRTLSCSLKQSFGLVMDNRRFTLPGTGPGSSLQQLQACISELQNVAKDMASATRMANDNYNLQVELTLQKHASQHLLSQLHEVQLSRMAMEEELTSLRGTAQQLAATEATVLHLRRLNDALQAEAQQASGELQELRVRRRELEEKLEATTAHAEHLAVRLREMELFEDVGSSHALLRDLYPSSDGGISEPGGGGSLAAAAAPGSQQPHTLHGADHGSSGRSAFAALAPANGGSVVGENGSVDSSSSHGVGARGHLHARDLPPDLRRALGKLLRRRDADTDRLRDENTRLAEEMMRLRDLLAAAEGRRSAAAPTAPAAAASCATAKPPTCPSSASAPGLLQPQLEQRPAAPWRLSSDSWHTEDDFEWATRPVTRLAATHSHPHPSVSRSHDGSEPQQQPEQQHPLHAPRQAQHRPPPPQGRQQLQPYGQGRQPAEQDPHQMQETTAELEAARETIARLTAELAEAQARLQTEVEADAATLKHRQAEVHVAEAATLRAEAQAAQAARALSEVEQAGSQLREKLREAQAALAEVEASRLETRATMEEAQEALRQEALREAASAEARAEEQAALAAQAQLQLVEAQEALCKAAAERSSLEAELREARQLLEAEAASSGATSNRMAADLAELQSQLAAATAANAELQGQLIDVERRERQARDGLAKELETARQRITRLQSDLRDYRAEAQVARGEATAASRDVKAANSEKLKAQREMEETVERLRQTEAQRDVLAAALAEAKVMAAAAAAAVATTEAEGHASERPGTEKLRFPVGGCGDGPTEAALATPATVRAEAVVLELEAARRELAAAEEQLAQERRLSEQDGERLAAQLKALQAELEAVRLELAAAEGQLAQSESAAAEAREQHLAETSQLRDSLAEARQRVSELEEQLATLRRAAEGGAGAIAAASDVEVRWRGLLTAAEKEADARLRQLEAQLQAAEAAQRQEERRLGEELEVLRARLAASDMAAAAASVAQAATAAAQAATAVAQPSNGSSASSSDVGMSGAGSPERSREAAAVDAEAARQGVGDMNGQEAAETAAVVEEDDEGQDMVTLRARCRALRSELALVRSRLVALTEVSEAAATGRLAEALAEAQAAAASGRVKNDEEFWAHNSEVHSLHALMTALRATCLYAGPAGVHAAYGDTRADGAGSVVAASADQLAASRRRRVLQQTRERCSQVAELLLEAEALTRLPPASPSLQQRHQQMHMQREQLLQCDALGVRSVDRPQASVRACSSSGDGSDEGRKARGRAAEGHWHSGGDAADTGDSGTKDSSLPEAPARAASRASVKEPGAEAAASSPLLRLGLHSLDGFALGSGLADVDAAQYGIYGGFPLGASGAEGAGGARRSYFGNGAGHGHGSDMSRGTVVPPPPAPVASSSFTSETGSSLVDDDLTSLSHLYEIPPMASPPKFDLSDLDFGNLPT